MVSAYVYEGQMAVYSDSVQTVFYNLFYIFQYDCSLSLCKIITLNSALIQCPTDTIKDNITPVCPV